MTEEDDIYTRIGKEILGIEGPLSDYARTEIKMLVFSLSYVEALNKEHLITVLGSEGKLEELKALLAREGVDFSVRQQADSGGKPAE